MRSLSAPLVFTVFMTCFNFVYAEFTCDYKWYAGVNSKYPIHNSADAACGSYDMASIGYPDVGYLRADVSSDGISAACVFSNDEGAEIEGLVGATRVCVADAYCEDPYEQQLTPNETLCAAYCEVGQGWDEVAESCIEEPEEETCETQGSNPIDFIKGRKYRAENIITVGNVFPIKLKYYYNNFSGREKTKAGYMAIASSNRYIASYKLAYNSTEVSSKITAGVATDKFETNQYFGQMERSWRHNYEDTLIKKNNEITYARADGVDITFEINGGQSKQYHNYYLTSLVSEEIAALGFSGKKLLNTSNNIVKYFDSDGYLRSVVNSAGLTHTVTYNENKVIESIEHSLKHKISFQYLSVDTEFASMPDTQKMYYPNTIVDNFDREVVLEWGKSITLAKNTQRLLTYKSDVSNTTIVNTGRRYAYEDERWPASITEIYDVTNNPQNTETVYAYFEYDDLGRAVLSSLANDQEKINVEYDGDNRNVINALGQATTFTFSVFDEVKRLSSVDGQATVNCAETNKSYTYWPNGTIKTEAKNNQIIYFEYNDRALEILRTEASGTPQARTIQTEWHADFSKPIKITEPERVTEYTYDDVGRLLNTKIMQVSY